VFDDLEVEEDEIVVPEHEPTLDTEDTEPDPALDTEDIEPDPTLDTDSEPTLNTEPDSVPVPTPETSGNSDN